MTPLQEITDEETLRLLEGGGQDRSSGAFEVADPALLQTLEGSAPEPIDEPVGQGKDVGTYGAFVTGFASDDTEKLRFLAHKLYPDEKIDEAVKRFGVRDGAIVHRADDGKLYEAVPGGLGTIASSVGPSIPIGTGTAMGVVTAPAAMTGVGFGPAVALTALTAAAGEGVRQYLGDYMMGEASTERLAALPVLEQAALGAVGQGVGGAMGAYANRFAVRDIAKMSTPGVSQAYDEASKAGVPITPAEATGLPSLGAQQKHLTNLAPTADKMRSFLDQRNDAVRKTWSDYLDSVSVARDAEDVGRMGRAAADNVLTEMRGALKAQAKPLYDAAYKQPVQVTAQLEDMMRLPAMQDAIEHARVLAENDKAPFQAFAQKVKDGGRRFWELTRDPSMQEWHYIKKGFDEALGSDKVINKATGGFNHLGRQIMEQKAALRAELYRQNPLYRQANEVYADGAEDVATAMQSALKMLADTKDTKILDAARHVFNPKTRSPQMISTLRTHIEGKDPQAWQALKRLYMQDVTSGAMRISEQGEVLNPAGKLFKAFSDDKVRENLFAAMTPEEKSRYHLLMKVFKRASSVQPLRSDTAYNLEAFEQMKKAATPLHAKVVKNLNPASALRSYEAWRTDQNLGRHAEAAAELITSGDPEALKTMRELRKLTTRGEQFTVLFGHLLSRASAFAGANLVGNADYAPER